MPRDCPVCGLVNPDTSPRCDCGFNFEGGSQALKEANAGGCLLAIVGLFVLFVGAVLSAFTVFATGGVRGIFFWGIFLVGLGMFVKGVSTYWKTRNYGQCSKESGLSTSFPGPGGGR
jgi:hypothetical protein